MTGTSMQTAAGGKLATISNLFNARKSAIQGVIAGDLTPERLFRIALSSISRTPALMNCTPESLYLAVHQSAQLGLEIGGGLGHAYMVPFGKDATFIPGYRGLAYLAHRCGAVKQLEAHVVYAEDQFELSYGTEDRCLFVPNFRADRGDAIGALSIAILPDGTRSYLFVPKEQIEKVRSASRAKNGDLWTKWWEEAWKKTAIRRHVKQLPVSQNAKSAPLQDAIAADEGRPTSVDVMDVEFTASEEPETATGRLAQKVKSQGQPKNEAPKESREDLLEAALGLARSDSDEMRVAIETVRDQHLADADAKTSADLDDAQLAALVSDLRGIHLQATN